MYIIYISNSMRFRVKLNQRQVSVLIPHSAITPSFINPTVSNSFIGPVIGLLNQVSKLSGQVIGYVTHLNRPFGDDFPCQWP